MNEYNESPMTHKQKQLEEFQLNCKQNKIKKYGKNNEPHNTPILNKNLRRRLENVTNGSIMNNHINIHQSERKRVRKGAKLMPDYTPSAFENKNVSFYQA